MLTFAAKRVLHLLPTLLGLATLVFLMLRLIPGDPAAVILGESASQERIEILRTRLGLDRPLPTQYLDFLGGVIQGDIGVSMHFGTPVSGLISQALPHTLRLALSAMVLSVVMGVPLGIVAALYRNTFLDVGLLVVSLLSLATPSFWLGLVSLWFFGGVLGWLPLSGVGRSGDLADILRHLVLPSAVLGASAAGLIMRLTRTSVLEVLGRDFVRTARSKGLTEAGVTIKHVFRNAVLPVLTISGTTLGSLMAGSVIVETVFSRPGLGKLIVDAIFLRDYPIVQGGVLVTGFLFVLTNLLVDLAYSIADPRIRFE